MLNPKEAKRLVEHCLPALEQCLPSSASSRKEQEQLIASLLSSPQQRYDIQVRNLCRLWGGMGYVYQIEVGSCTLEIIVKQVSPTGNDKKKLSLGDRRKADSYECEANFYQHLAPLLLRKGLEIPIPLHVERGDNGEMTICMTKLHGGESSCNNLEGDEETKAVLRWLATLHAATWGPMADKAVDEFGLQPQGTYWYLETRPDEHASIRSKGWEGRLKRAAKAIDERLKRDPMQCCVHGDAKRANMLFRYSTQDPLVVEMYDFQYCGKAPPTKDLAYFLCVAADDDNASSYYLEYYHGQLLGRLAKSLNYPTLEELQDSLDLANCDWARFMAGWGFWGNDISKDVIRVLDRLDGGKDLGSEDAYRVAVLREYG